MGADLSGVGCKFRPQTKCQGNTFISAIMYSRLQYSMYQFHTLADKICVLYGSVQQTVQLVEF